ncbi:ring-cleaving dioxygenase [bacterium]|nr:MAG: ring-cleaving dioxygenase [bacterium]
MDTISGIHHVTAICSDAQTNIDFYTGILGLRLVKLTVNFDDPFAYHLYYGDEQGSPGSILTFFAWGGGSPGRHGNRAVEDTALAVPPGACDYWKKRLAEKGIPFISTPSRWGEDFIQFRDPDGLVLEIVATERAVGGHPWEKGGIPVEAAIRGVHSVTIAAEGFQKTADVLTGTLGFKPVEGQSVTEPNRYRFEAGSGIGGIVDVACLPGAPRTTTGTGTVHHVAFRVEGDAAQLRYRNEIVREGYNVSPVMDRNYFHSIYFREPGGVLFELATDNPGFAVDESAATLGTSLKLPAQFEGYRTQIEERVAKVKLPEVA